MRVCAYASMQHTHTLHTWYQTMADCHFSITCLARGCRESARRPREHTACQREISERVNPLQNKITKMKLILIARTLGAWARHARDAHVVHWTAPRMYGQPTVSARAPGPAAGSHKSPPNLVETHLLVLLRRQHLARQALPDHRDIRLLRGLCPIGCEFMLAWKPL